ncbi:MAG: hypothetical protein P4L40_24955 [Terracidiphilus sp.]|nr:hypothetical protein [Terracidiphilus sp.]
MRRIRIDTIREKSSAEKLWDLTWGLLLVVGLTVVSECGMRLGYSKTAPDGPAVSQPMVPAVK